MHNTSKDSTCCSQLDSSVDGTHSHMLSGLADVSTANQSEDSGFHECFHGSSALGDVVDVEDVEKQPNLVTESNLEESSRTIYSKRELYMITAIISFAQLFSTISSPIYLPAFKDLEKYFHVSVENINLTVTVYSIFQGVAPAIWGTLSDSVGRRPVYVACFTIYIMANIILALAHSYWVLFAMRMVQAAGIASTVSIASGVVGDFTTRKTRGWFMGVTSGFSLIGNCFGPLVGGGLASGLGWRSIFWFLTIGSGFCFCILLVFLPETNRFVASDGSYYPNRFINRSPYIHFRSKRLGVPVPPQDARHDSLAPTDKHPVDIFGSIRLLREFDVICMLIPTSLQYTMWFMILTAQSTLLVDDYDFRTSQVGFSYLASGVGSLGGSLLSGKILTWFYKRMMQRYKQDCIENGKKPEMSEFNIQQARLGVLVIPTLLQFASALVFGWTIEKRVQYVVPLISTFFTSSASVIGMSCVQTLLIDLFPNDSASTTGILNLCRCLLCAAGLAVVDKMIAALGVGGAFTLIAGIVLISNLTIVFEYIYGKELEKKRIKRKERM